MKKAIKPKIKDSTLINPDWLSRESLIYPYPIQEMQPITLLILESIPLDKEIRASKIEAGLVVLKYPNSL